MALLFETLSTLQDYGQNRSLNASSNGHSNSSILDQEHSSHSSTMSVSAVPLCRQFWKAGNYENAIGSKAINQSWKNYLHVHPMFLHSNATSHKWAFGAIAELLDNSIDEIQNGATFVAVDKVTNPRNGSTALLFKDDGGGMSPEAMRRCMSFGFTDKREKSLIGRYGNGFKTSTMRLGADVIVFSRHLENRVLTQSIGLLSYSFLRRTGYDRIVVPMVHYEFNTLTGKLDFLHGKDHFMSNLSKLLQWSPYSTEPELLEQFEDIGSHGTKVIIYNLWLNDDGIEELDFNTDATNILISGDTKQIETPRKTVNEQHCGNRFAFSLRAYISILYLRIPESFRIVLRGEVVKHHNIADDLIFPEYIMYRPHGHLEAQVITTIGYLKEAPKVTFHGFSVYHKNRLILPFWRVVDSSHRKGRGIVGVLEANFVEPTHNKQEFEKTSLFERLESRLKSMTYEYWDFHYGLLGYHASKKSKDQTTLLVSSSEMTTTFDQNSASSPKISKEKLSDPLSRDQQGLHMKRKEHGIISKDIGNSKRPAVTSPNVKTTMGNYLKDQEAVNLMNTNRMLRAKCLEYEEEEIKHYQKVVQLKAEIEEAKNMYDQFFGELREMEATNLGNDVDKIYTLFCLMPSSSYIDL